MYFSIMILIFTLMYTYLFQSLTAIVVGNNIINYVKNTFVEIK